MKLFVWTVILAGCAAFWFAVAHAWVTWRSVAYETQLAECRGDALAAAEHRDQLLSRGRFVRRYDAKTGASVYTFAANKVSR
jgi:hypothetical protein